MGVTSLTDTSTPASAWTYTGDAMGKPLTEITEDTESGTVKFKFRGGSSSGIATANKDSHANGRIYSLTGLDKGTD